MKRTASTLFTTLLTTFTLLSFAQTSQASPRLTAAQTAKLTATGAPIVLPATLPKGFTLSDVITNGCTPGSSKPGCRFGPTSTIVYRNPENTCLLVNMMTDGIGGGSAEFELATRSALLGDVMILFGEPTGANQSPTAADRQTYPASLSSFPARIQNQADSPYYSVAVAAAEGYDAQFQCSANRSISPDRLAKIVRSLKVVK